LKKKSRKKTKPDFSRLKTHADILPCSLFSASPDQPLWSYLLGPLLALCFR
jgi:hypothetical protein